MHRIWVGFWWYFIKYISNAFLSFHILILEAVQKSKVAQKEGSKLDISSFGKEKARNPIKKREKGTIG